MADYPFLWSMVLLDTDEKSVVPASGGAEAIWPSYRRVCRGMWYATRKVSRRTNKDKQML